MPARWRLAAVFLSISVFVGAALLWARSGFYADQIDREGGHVGVFATSSNGQIGVLVEIATVQIPAGWQVSHWPASGFKGSLHFGWINRTQTYGQVGRAVRLHTVAVVVPTWTLMALSTVPPLWFFWRGRRGFNWDIRADIRGMNFRLRSRVGRFAVFSFMGAAAGAVIGWLDSARYDWTNSWQWILTLLMLFPIVGILIILTRRRIPWRHGLLWMGLEIAGCVCFFIAALRESWRFFAGNAFPDVDVLPIGFSFGLASFILGAALLYLLQLRPKPVKAGPYCPECGYCLIGVPRQICPECGRPFTLDELGVTADALTPG